MNNEEQLKKHYKSQGYKDFGCVNISQKAYEACQKSKNKQEHKIGRCEYLIACHDLKVFVTVDSSD